MQKGSSSLTRRDVLNGIGAAAGAAGLVAALPPSTASAAVVNPAIGDSPLPADEPLLLRYYPLDALAFSSLNDARELDSDLGVTVTSASPVVAPLLLPGGSIIRNIRITYRGKPSVAIAARPFGTSAVTEANVPVFFPTDAGPGVKTKRISFAGEPIATDELTTYFVQLNLGPGDAVYGVIIGYLDPSLMLAAFAGPTRVFDSRSSTKLAPNEERIVNLGYPARGAVLNLTLTETEGPGGFVSLFAANDIYDGTSTQNWFAPGSNVANNVITALDGAGRIKIRGGDNKTHVVIDLVALLN
jgi:hypothetical protein